MKGLKILMLALFVTGCHAGQQIPTQVVYRFDEHRFLELKGYNCEGELWYSDTQRDIHSQIASQFYRIFTRKFVHPSERYIAIPWWGSVTGGFSVSKDYGRTWEKGGHQCPQEQMSLMGIMPQTMKMCFLSPWLTIRDFYRPNTACICPQNRLMIPVFSPAGRGGDSVYC